MPLSGSVELGRKGEYNGGDDGVAPQSIEQGQETLSLTMFYP